MSIELFIEPGKVYDWESFKLYKPPFSMGLDGIVSEITMRDRSGPYGNLDHHSADRTSTRSTSDQVHMEINMNLFKTFQQNGIPTMNIFVNDCDEDTCLAVWLLLNHERVIGHAEPSINRLVHCEDRLDVTAGAYPLGDIKIRRIMAWIFEPYNHARFSGQLKALDAAGMRSIIEAVCGRITAYSLGRGEEMALEGQYERIGGGSGWALVKETGSAARVAMYNEGIEAYFTYLGEEKGRHHYAAGRKSEWIDFDLFEFFMQLNKLDTEITSTSQWGPASAATTVGGSPRGNGSSFNPQQLEDVINKIREDQAA